MANIFGLYPTGAPEAVTSAATTADLSLDSFVSVVTTSTATDAVKVPAKNSSEVLAKPGQLKLVKYIDGGTGHDLVVTLGTLDSEASPATVTMDADGDNALFCFDGTAWVVIENNIA